MTLFILTILFVLNSMIGMVQPYSSTAEDNNRLADRVTDKLYTDTLTSSTSKPGEFSYNNFSTFFEDLSDSEVRNELGFSDVNQFNITVSSGYTNYGPTEGLVKYWPLNERQSKEAKDIAGDIETRTNGDIEGNVSTDVRGISSSGAYRFNSPDAAIRVGNDSSLNPAADTGNMTVSAWVKPESAGPDPLQFGTIVAKGLNTGYQLHLQNGRPTFEKGAGAEAQASVTLNDGEWYHIVGVYDSTASDRLKIYVNSDSDPSWWDNDSIGNTPDDFGIGRNLQSTNPDDRHFSGVIDEVRLYNRALEPNQIETLYDRASVLSPDKTDPSSPAPLQDTTYTLGEEAPSGQDIVSVSTRKRVGYVTTGGTEESGPGSAERNRVEFVAVSDNSQNSIQIEYGTGSGVDVGPVVESCAQAPNAKAGVQPPCPDIIKIGIDGNGDGTIDAGRDASDDVECCPSSDGVIPMDSNTTLRIETSGNYNIDAGETLIVEYPKVHDGVREVTANANGDGSKNVRSRPAETSSRNDIGPVEVDVRLW